MPLDPEAPAHVRRDHTYVVLGQPEGVGHARAQEVRDLGRRVECQRLRRGVPVRHTGAALQREPGMTMGAVRVLPHERSGGERAIDIAARDAAVEEEVVAPRLVHERAAGLGGPLEIDRDREGLVVDLDQLGEVLGLVPVGRHHHRHRLAHEPHARPRQHGELRPLPLGKGRVAADRSRGADGFLRRQQADEPGRRHGPLRAHGGDGRVGMRAAHEGGVDGARQAEVVHVTRAAGEKATVLAPHDPLADVLGGAEAIRLRPRAGRHDVTPRPGAVRAAAVAARIALTMWT
jgi:hypothetical protein